MMCTIQVTAQYYENYSDTTSPYWKPKGSTYFDFPLDVNVELYTPKDVLQNALIKMVEEQSNGHARYEYLDHEVKFSQPIVVEGLGKELEKMLVG